MLISFERHFAFIHIQKAAGISIHRALMRAAPDAQPRLPGLKASDDPLKNRHMFASDLQAFLGADAWSGLFTFAFVRNPYSRLVSWYNMCIERPTTPFMKLVKNETKSFDDFLHLTRGRAARTTFNQADYVTDTRGDVIVNFIGRFETLQNDFDAVCQQLGIKYTLPHINRTRSVDYRSYYNDRTRKLVADRFQRDIELFGYSFEGYGKKLVTA
jgi:chondroitin 4-sulfotransferase 11